MNSNKEQNLGRVPHVRKLPFIYRCCNWIGRITGTIILVPHLWKIGDRAEQIYFGLLKARREGKKLFILLPYELPWRFSYQIVNREVTILNSEYRVSPSNVIPHIIGRVVITLYFALSRSISFLLKRLFQIELNALHTAPSIGTYSLWQPEDQMPGFSWEVVDTYEWSKQLEKPLKITLTKQQKLNGELKRLEMGLPEDAWFFCLHVREDGFWNNQTGYRSADIDNYIEAIKEVTSRGGWIVRMGDSTMKRLPLEMEHVIDYPFTSVKSDLMDLYLVSKCQAFLGTSSGLLEIATLFQRPIIMTNMFSWLWGFPPKEGDIGLLKHLYSKSRNRFLSIYEWVSEGSKANFYKDIQDDYILFENDSEEIKTLVQEFLGRSDDWQPTSIQRKFSKYRAREGRIFIRDCEPMWEDNFFETFVRYQLASRLDSAIGVLGDEFLQRNWQSSVRHLSKID